MQKIGDITPTADANGEWTNGNVAGGTPPTLIDARWLNTIQRELINILAVTGVTTDPTKDNQVMSSLAGYFLQNLNNLSEIKTAGANAQGAARTNIGAAALTGLATQLFSVAAATGDNHAVNLKQLTAAITALSLGSASTRAVGTGANQIPDMSSFTFSGTFGGWVAKFPQGLIIQGGVTAPITSAPYDTGFAFPIPFPNQVLNIWDFNIAPAGGSQKVEWSFNNPSLLGGSVRAIGVMVQGSASINSPFSGLTCGWVAIGR